MDDSLLQRHYPGGAPIIIQVAFVHGYGEAIVELNKKVYFNEQPLLSPVIREAIQGVCLSSCENQYCVIMHSRGLITEGFTLDDIERLVTRQTLPKFVPDRAEWEHSLRRIATIFREPRPAAHLYKSLAEFHDGEVIEEIGGVIAFSLLHKFLLELYSEEIDIEQEPILFKTIDEPQALISFFMKIEGKDVPTLTLCSLCKDVKSGERWRPIETVLHDIPSDAAFSHGICEKCFERWLS